MIKKCEICGKEFQAKSNQERYCKNIHKVNCIICNKEIILKTATDKARYIKLGFKTCSKDCSNKKMLLTNKEKYGYNTPFANPNIKAKIKKIQQTENYKKNLSDNIKKAKRDISKDTYKKIYEKTKRTNLEKYGVECSLLSPKRNQTMLKKYNSLYTAQSSILLDKMKQTNKEKYGVEFPFQNKEIQEKCKNSYKNKSKEEKYNIVNKRKNKFKLKTGYDHPRQLHLSQKVLEIIHNQEKLYEYIQNIPFENRSPSIIAKTLGLSESYTSKLIKELLNKYNDCKINYYTSNFEYEVEDFLKSLNKKYSKNNRELIAPYEVDFYFPEDKVAIECNGTYYHSYNVKKDKNYHYKKSLLCEEKQIRLIHIWEYEWNNIRQQPILKNIIKNALNINEYKIYARNCNLIIKKSKDMREFFNSNNIQGFRPGKFAICLADKNTNEVYMSYMMGSAFFGKGKYEWEVIRGATKLGYTIVGGASKIFKYFIKTYNPDNCVYYIDYNYFNGNSLKNLPNMNFIKTQISFKNYFIKDKIIKNRDPIHNKEINILYKENKVWKIYNAGTKVYVWQK